MESNQSKNPFRNPKFSSKNSEKVNNFQGYRNPFNNHHSNDVKNSFNGKKFNRKDRNVGRHWNLERMAEEATPWSTFKSSLEQEKQNKAKGPATNPEDQQKKVNELNKRIAAKKQEETKWENFSDSEDLPTVVKEKAGKKLMKPKIQTAVKLPSYKKSFDPKSLTVDQSNFIKKEITKSTLKISKQKFTLGQAVIDLKRNKMLVKHKK